jgi:hypothetical protein
MSINKLIDPAYGRKQATSTWYASEASISVDISKPTKLIEWQNLLLSCMRMNKKFFRKRLKIFNGKKLFKFREVGNEMKRTIFLNFLNR